MARSRFIAPARESVPPAVFAHPVFAGYARHHDLLLGDAWPSPSMLDARLDAHSAAGARLRFASQSPALLEDGLHYETRIHDAGLIATRPCNWHDLLNALVWFEHAPIKRALNLRQVQEIAQVGPRARSRAQCALTHFDEAGAVLWLEDRRWLQAWDTHDWRAWFGRHEAFAEARIQVHVFGHALLEHALWPGHRATAKCLVLCGGRAEDWQQELAHAIAAGTILNDPQELRPLPLAGLPGWCDKRDEAGFFDTESFRPLRPGRVYPAPLMIGPAWQDQSDP